MSSSQPAVNVHSAAEGIRTAARLARLKASIVTKSDNPHVSHDPVAEAFESFADELDAIAEHVNELGSPGAKGQ